MQIGGIWPNQDEASLRRVSSAKMQQGDVSIVSEPEIQFQVFSRDQSKDQTKQEFNNASNMNELSYFHPKSEPVFLSTISLHSIPYAILVLPYMFNCIGILGSTVVFIVFLILQSLHQHLLYELIEVKGQVRLVKLVEHLFEQQQLAYIVQAVIIFNSVFLAVLMLNICSICSALIYGTISDNNPDNRIIYYAILGLGSISFVFILCQSPRVDHLPWTNLIALAGLAIVIIICFSLDIKQSSYFNVPTIDDSDVKIVSSAWAQGIVSLTCVMLIFSFNYQKELYGYLYQQYNRKQVQSKSDYLGSFLSSLVYYILGLLAYLSYKPYIKDSLESIPYFIFQDISIPKYLRVTLLGILILPALYQYQLYLGISIFEFKILKYWDATVKNNDQLIEQIRNRSIVRPESMTIVHNYKIHINDDKVLIIITQVSIIMLSLFSADIMNVIILLGSTSSCFLLLILPGMIFHKIVRNNKQRIYQDQATPLIIAGILFSLSCVVASIFLIIKYIT